MSERQTPRARFVVLRHEVTTALDRTDRTHFDWMFDVGETLIVWATDPVRWFDAEFEVADAGSAWEIPCERLPDHRRFYLDHEGEVSADRGTVRRVVTGVYDPMPADGDRSWSAALRWNVDGAARRAEVTCYRSAPEGGRRVEDNCDGWRLRFSLGRYETNR